MVRLQKYWYWFPLHPVNQIKGSGQSKETETETQYLLGDFILFLFYYILFIYFSFPALCTISSPKASKFLDDNPQHVIASAHFLNIFCQEIHMDKGKGNAAVSQFNSKTILLFFFFFPHQFLQWWWWCGFGNLLLFFHHDVF